MFFLCFSGRDRKTVAQSVLFHLQKFGVNVWYDNYEHTLGDNKCQNYVTGIKKSKYAVVIFSQHFPNSPGAIEELNVIKELYSQKKIHIFPLFYNISADAIPPDYAWLRDLIYNEINDSTGTLLSCRQMIYQFFKDALDAEKYRSLSDIQLSTVVLPSYVRKLLNDYFLILPHNINSRMTILYCIFAFLCDLMPLASHLTRTVDYLFQTTYLELPYNHKEISLMEQAVCLAVNRYIAEQSLRI